MPDGKEEREEQKRRLEEEKKKDWRDRVFHQDEEFGAPERGGS
jgi:hypothetical protein